jgi:hypothetical protein
MRYVSAALLAFAFIASPIQSVSAQTGTQTVNWFGIMDGKRYTSITIDYDRRTITYHHTDGSNFTQGGIDPIMLQEFASRIKNRSSN